MSEFTEIEYDIAKRIVRAISTVNHAQMNFPIHKEADSIWSEIDAWHREEHSDHGRA